MTAHQKWWWRNIGNHEAGSRPYDRSTPSSSPLLKLTLSTMKVRLTSVNPTQKPAPSVPVTVYVTWHHTVSMAATCSVAAEATTLKLRNARRNATAFFTGAATWVARSVREFMMSTPASKKPPKQNQIGPDIWGCEHARAFCPKLVDWVDWVVCGFTNEIITKKRDTVDSEVILEHYQRKLFQQTQRKPLKGFAFLCWGQIQACGSALEGTYRFQSDTGGDKWWIRLLETRALGNLTNCFSKKRTETFQRERFCRHVAANSDGTTL